MRDKVVVLAEDTMVGGDGAQDVIGSEEIEFQLGLGKELRPIVDREGRVGAD